MRTCERIASLLASGTEILYGLGLGDRVVAVSHECDYPAEVVQKPRATFVRISTSVPSKEIDEQVRRSVAAGSSMYQIDHQLLASLAPDLIITQAHCHVCAVSSDDVEDVIRNGGKLTDAHLLALNPTSLEGIFRDIVRVGDTTGCGDRARSYVDGLRRRVEVVRARTNTLSASQRPRVACIEWINPVMVSANWMPELVQLAGGHNGLTRAGERTTYTDWDTVLAYDPQVIVVMPCGFDLRRALNEAPELATLPRWNELTACKAGRVYAVDGNAYFNRSGPRIVESLEILACLLHPTLFPDAGLADRCPWAQLRALS